MKIYPALLLLAACHCPPPVPDAAATSTSSTATTSASTGPESPACIEPGARHDVCVSASDCWVAGNCTAFACVTVVGDPCPVPTDAGTAECHCAYEQYPSGHGCDGGTFRGTCAEGSCCPAEDAGVVVQ